MKQQVVSLKYNVLFRAEPEGGFTAMVPSLPGCISYGKTLEKAKAMILDAVDGYVSSLDKRGRSIPTDENSFIGTINVSSKAHA